MTEKNNQTQEMSNAIINLHFHVNRLYKVLEEIIEDETHKDISSKLREKSKKINEECVEILKKNFPNVTVTDSSSTQSP